MPLSPAALPLVAACFVFCGVAYGGQGVLFAEIITALGFSTGAYGTAELAPPFIGFLFLAAGGRLSQMLGQKAVALSGYAAFAIAALLLARATGLAGFALSLFILGIGYGAMEMAMNAAALDWEAATGRRALSALHAAFSAGAILGAALAGLLLQNGLSYAAILQGFAGLSLVLLAATVPVPFPPSVEAESGVAAAWSLLGSSRPLRLFAAIAMLGVVGEAVANNWSVIHLKALGAEAIVGGGAYALFNAAMLAGRLANAPLLARRGPEFSLRLSGAMLVLSGGLLLAGQSLPVVITALAFTGLGVAGIIPTTLTAAADAAPGRTAEVTSLIMGAVYLAFGLCAPLVGWLAEWIPLRAALAVVPFSGLAILLLAGNSTKATGRR